MWIRSANKMFLGNYKEFLVKENEIIGFKNGPEDFTTLGIYDTKERSLEVLGDIEDRILKGLTRDTMECKVRVTSEEVFRMPEK